MQAFYNALTPFTNVPFNFWLYLLFVTAPVLAFSAGPERNVWLRSGRLIVAAALTYLLLNLSHQTDQNLIRKAYEQCQSQFPDGWIQHHKECSEINTADGAHNAFLLYLGWIPAMAYVGFWELVWRRRNKSKLKKLELPIRDKILGGSVSCLMIFFFVLTATLVAILTGRILLF